MNDLSRKAAQVAKFVVLALVLIYAADWAVFAARQMRGSGLDSVAVDQFLRTPMKGSKMEYDYMGTGSEACGRAAFPQYAQGAWRLPCWWVKRHPVQWQ